MIRVTTTGTHIDDYVEAGVYYFASSAKPTDAPYVNGWLIVRVGAGSIIRQDWLRVGSVDSCDDVSTRTRINNVWSDWSEFVTTRTTHKEISITTNTQSNYTINNFVVLFKNGIVDVNLSVTVITTSTSWITIGTLPVGYRPITTAYKDAPYLDASKNYKHLRMKVNTNGTIQLALGESEQNYAFHDTFIGE